MECFFIWCDQVYLCLNEIPSKIYHTTMHKGLKLVLFLQLQQKHVCTIWKIRVSLLCLSTTIFLILWYPETFAWRNTLIDSSLRGIYYLHWLSTKQAFALGLLLLTVSPNHHCSFFVLPESIVNTEIRSNKNGACLAPTEKPTLTNTTE